MTRIWGDTEDLSDFTKRNLEEHLENVLKRKRTINFRDLIKEFWQPYYLLTHFMRIKILIRELEIEGKIVVNDEENISMTQLSFLDLNGFNEVSVWDLEHKKTEIEEKKEIIRRYQTINYFA